VVAAPDAVPVEAASSDHAADDRAFRTTGEETSQDVEAPQSDPIDVPWATAAPHQVSAARRRLATLASAASVAVALALLAYVLFQQRFEPSLSRNAQRDIVANQAKIPAPPAPGADSLRRAAGSVSPASSAESSVPPPAPQPASRAVAVDAAPAKAPQNGDNLRGPVADQVPGAAGAAPERALPATPASAATPTPPCSGRAFALGLCDAESSSTRR
jgi:hypothetical protein